MTEETNWIPGLIAGGAGLALGLLAAWRLRGSSKRTNTLERRDLEAEWTSLKIQLLEARSSEQNQPEQAHHRYALELRAAELLKERHVAESSSPEPSPIETPTNPSNDSPRRASWVGAVWGALATAAILVPLLLVQNHATERAEGGSVTGNTGPAGGPTGAPPATNSAPIKGAPPMKGAPDPALKPLRDAVDANPKSAAPRLALIRAQIGRRQLIQAYEGSNEVLKIEPDNPQAKTFLAIVRIEMGMSSQATKLLSEALQANPGLVEAWIYRGVANMQTGEAQAALDDWQEAMKLRPDSARVLQPLIERAEGILDGSIQQAAPKPHPGGSQGMPSGHPPASSAPQALAPAPKPAPVPAGPPAKITIKLAAGAQAKAGEIIFVIARPAGVAAGPPAAVKRLTVESFPIEVSLTNADMMMGGSLPKTLDITARVDGDGNPLTKNDGVRGQVKGVIVGGDAASLTLQTLDPSGN